MERKILDNEKQSFTDLYGNIKKSNICVIGDAEEEVENVAEKKYLKTYWVITSR